MAQIWIALLSVLLLTQPVLARDFAPKSCAETLAETLPAEGRRVEGAVSFDIHEPIKNVFYLRFDTQQEATSTFLRFQEHYESPKFRGKTFTLEEFQKWYVKENGMFSYYWSVAGFNFPSYVLEPFFDGKFDPLTDAEKQVVEIFRQHRGEKFYVIASYKESRSLDSDEIRVVRHELAHSLFFMDDEYRAKVQAILSRINYDDVRAKLIDKGYSEEVLEDEAHAYLLNDARTLKFWGVDVAPYRNIIRELNSLFEPYFQKWKARLAD